MVQTSLIKTASIFILISCLLFSCREIDLFEKNVPVPNMQWYNNFNASGSFLIKDTNSTYNVIVVLRHTDAYQYNNIWLNIGLRSPSDSAMKFQKINISLGNDATGWEGVGMNDIWEVRKVISGLPKRFINSGEYKFEIRQLMRDNPLPNIMSIGMAIQKAQ